MGKKNKETKGKKPIEMYSLSTIAEVQAALDEADSHELTAEVMTAAIWFAGKYPKLSIARVLTLAKGEWIK